MASIICLTAAPLLLVFFYGCCVAGGGAWLAVPLSLIGPFLPDVRGRFGQRMMDMDGGVTVILDVLLIVDPMCPWRTVGSRTKDLLESLDVTCPNEVLLFIMAAKRRSSRRAEDVPPTSRVLMEVHVSCRVTVFDVQCVCACVLPGECAE